MLYTNIYHVHDICTLQELWGPFEYTWQLETVEHHNGIPVAKVRLTGTAVMEKLTKDQILDFSAFHKVLESRPQILYYTEDLK